MPVRMEASADPVRASRIWLIPRLRLAKSPEVKFRKKGTGKASRRSHTAAWIEASILVCSRRVARLRVSVNNAVARALITRKMLNSAKVARWAPGITVSKIMPVKTGVTIPNRPAAIPMRRMVAASAPQSLSPKERISRRVSALGGKGR